MSVFVDTDVEYIIFCIFYVTLKQDGGRHFYRQTSLI